MISRTVSDPKNRIVAVEERPLRSGLAPPGRRIEALEARRASLKAALDRELNRPLPDRGEVLRLKRLRLQLKDQIMRHAATPRMEVRA